MTRGDYAYYDRIFVMDQNNLRYLHWQMPEIVQQLSGRQYGDPQGKIQLLMELVGNPRDVADPWYTGNFEATYNDVVAGCKALLAE